MPIQSLPSGPFPATLPMRLRKRLEYLLDSGHPRHLRLVLASLFLAECAPLSQREEKLLAALTVEDLRRTLTTGVLCIESRYVPIGPWTCKAIQRKLMECKGDPDQSVFPSRLAPDKPLLQLRPLLRQFLRPVSQSAKELHRFDAQRLLEVEPPSPPTELPSDWSGRLRHYLHLLMQQCIDCRTHWDLRLTLLFLLAAESGVEQTSLGELGELTLASVQWSDESGAAICYQRDTPFRKISPLLEAVLRNRMELEPNAPDSPLLVPLNRTRRWVSGILRQSTLLHLSADFVAWAKLRRKFFFADLVQLWRGNITPCVRRLAQPGTEDLLVRLLDRVPPPPSKPPSKAEASTPAAPPSEPESPSTPNPKQLTKLTARKFAIRLANDLCLNSCGLTSQKCRGALALLLLVEQQQKPQIQKDELPSLRRRDVEWRNRCAYLSFRLCSGTTAPLRVSWPLELLLREVCPPDKQLFRKDKRHCLVGTTHNPTAPVPLAEFVGLAARYLEDFALAQECIAPDLSVVLEALSLSLNTENLLTSLFEKTTPALEPPAPYAEVGAVPVPETSKTPEEINLFGQAAHVTAPDSAPTTSYWQPFPSDLMSSRVDDSPAVRSSSPLSVQTVSLRTILQPLHACRLTISFGLLLSEEPGESIPISAFNPCTEVHSTGAPFTFNSAWALATLPFPLYTPYLRVAVHDSEQPDQTIYTSQIVHVTGDPDVWCTEPAQIAIPLLPFLVEINRGSLVFGLQGLVRRHAPHPTTILQDGDWMALAVHEIQVN